MDRALIIRQPWIDLILSGKKVWEMRSRPTKIRGRIGLIEQGTGLIVGECNLDDCISGLSHNRLYGFTPDKHLITDESLLIKWNIAWVISGAKRYKTPIPYKHPRGAVTWVKLNPALRHRG